MRFLLYQSIISTIFLVDALLNTRYLLELERLLHYVLFFYERKQLFF